MIIEQNVPTPVRAWAECQVEIRNNEHTIRILEDGKPIDFNSYASIKAIGRARYREECCKPKIAALKQRNAKCRELADKISRESEISPENWLLSKHEALNLIGNTLHYSVRGKEVRPSKTAKTAALAILSPTAMRKDRMRSSGSRKLSKGLFPL